MWACTLFLMLTIVLAVVSMWPLAGHKRGIKGNGGSLSPCLQGKLQSTLGMKDSLPAGIMMRIAGVPKSAPCGLRTRCYRF